MGRTLHLTRGVRKCEPVMRHRAKACAKGLVLHREHVNLHEMALHERSQGCLGLAVDVLLAREFGGVHLRFKARASDDAGSVLRERFGDAVEEVILLARVDVLEHIEGIGGAELAFLVFPVHRVPVFDIGLHEKFDGLCDHRAGEAVAAAHFDHTLLAGQDS